MPVYILQSYYFYNEFEDNEKAFAAVSDNKVIGFAALLKECCYCTGDVSKR